MKKTKRLFADDMDNAQDGFALEFFQWTEDGQSAIDALALIPVSDVSDSSGMAADLGSDVAFAMFESFEQPAADDTPANSDISLTDVMAVDAPADVDSLIAVEETLAGVDGGEGDSSDALPTGDLLVLYPIDPIVIAEEGGSDAYADADMGAGHDDGVTVFVTKPVICSAPEFLL